MTFARLWVLNFLWTIPLVVLVLVIAARRKRRALDTLADPELLERLTGRSQRSRLLLKGVLLSAAMGLMLLSLAGPRWGSHYQEIRQKGVDIMIAVDVSPSMTVADVAPDRLERARREIMDFLKVVRGDRVGLIAFSGAGICPVPADAGLRRPSDVPSRTGTRTGARARYRSGLGR